MSGMGTIRVYRPDPSQTEQTQLCGPASFTTLPLSPSLVVVTISGEIDATNGRALGRYVERHTTASSQMIVDLSGVKFFGAQGFT
ncbi:MAG: STAS domain-containing protein, partial [Mycobacterium sp.]